MGEKKVLKFNHSNIVSEKKQKKKSSSSSKKIDDGFNEMTKELRNRLITRNKELSKEKPTNFEHSMKSEINNFDNAIKFLERIREKRKKKEKRTHKNTVKCHTKKFPSNTEEDQSQLKDDPPCGILKNGKKPLWRDYHKTRKKKLTVHDDSLDDEISPIVIEPTDAVVEPTVAVVEPTPAVVEPTVAVVEPTVAVVEPTPAVVEPTPAVVEPKAAVVEPTLAVVVEKPKTKILLGKSKSKLRFLLKTRKRRKKSNRYTKKNVLKNNGLLSSNSNAPEDVIETMYDAIVNDNGETLCKVNKE